jgi:hypothetical protein
MPCSAPRSACVRCASSQQKGKFLALDSPRSTETETATAAAAAEIEADSSARPPRISSTNRSPEVGA